jgi:cobalt/nickel transport system permease protein
MTALPDWLGRPERYQAPRGRNAFLDRGLVSLLGVLARARGPRPGSRGGTDPLVKVAAALVTVLAVALTRSPRVLSLAGTGLLALLALQDRACLAAVLGSTLGAAAMAGLVLLPAAFLGQGPAAWRLVARVALSTAAVRLVSASTGWAALSGALRRLGVPDLFLLVLDLALNYLVLLGGFAAAMVAALKLRSVGRRQTGCAALGAVAGTLFLKSLAMAEDLYDAMRCRDFTGEYQPSGRLRLGFREAALGAAAAGLAAAFFLAGA